jgi:hypothetical protein
MNPWPFQDPPNVAVIVDRQILGGDAWITYVSHDAEDGAWQFHSSSPGPPNERDAAVIGLREILSLDETVAELADLPPGWHAWREFPASAWQRARTARSS